MDQMTYHVPTGFVWPTLGRPGPVPLWALIPTPDQPRIEFDPIELQALADTMKKENGGKQRDYLTVRELTVEERKARRPARYMVKSGERRMRAAELAGLDMADVIVQEYDSRAEEMLSTWMYNENRVGLSYYENAQYLVRLIAEFGWKTQAEIVRATGKDLMWVSDHMAFGDLDPMVQERMNPLKVNKKDRYKREVGVFFARFDPDVQRNFHEQMPPKCKTVKQQIGWMTQFAVSKGISIGDREVAPRRIRQKMDSYCTYVISKGAAFLATEGFEKLFETLTPQQALKHYHRLLEMRSQVGELVQEVEALLPGSVQPQKKLEQAAPKPVVQVQQVQPMPRPVTPAPVPVQGTIDDAARERLLERARDAARAKPVRAPITPGTLPARIPVDYYNVQTGKMVRGGTVNHSQFVKLWGENNLAFQIEGKSTPADLPTLQEVRTEMARLRT